MKGNKYYAEITYLRNLKGITFKEVAKKCGVSGFWLREKIKEGNTKYIEKTKKIIEEF